MMTVSEPMTSQNALRWAGLTTALVMVTAAAWWLWPRQPVLPP